MEKEMDKTDVAGTWNLNVDLQGDSGTIVLTFQQKGKKLTGTYQGSLGEVDVTGTITGDQIEFTFEAEIVVVYKGTVDGDKMKGTCDYGGYVSGKWTKPMSPAPGYSMRKGEGTAAHLPLLFNKKGRN